MSQRIRNAVLGVLTAITLATTSTIALADADDYGPGYGSGMGPGMMGPGYGYGHGYGMGPGMMGGYYGMGPGMMGPGYGMGHGMGPGMMGGYYGMGPGMMGNGYGYGMHPGTMGTEPLEMLNLTDAQRSKIAQIRDNVRKKNWPLMGQMMDEQSQLQQLYATETPDPKKVGEAYSKLSELRRQMIENSVEARNQMLAVLTPEQRKELDQYWGGGGVGGPGGPRGPYPGMGRGMMGMGQGMMGW